MDVNKGCRHSASIQPADNGNQPANFVSAVETSLPRNEAQFAILSYNMQCAGCLRTIKDRKYLLCEGCNQFYDLDCANVSEQRFYNTLVDEHRRNWRCVLCVSKKPKSDNTNTPARAAFQAVTTQRGGAVRSPLHFDVSMSEQPSIMDIHNDTAQNETVEMSDMQSLALEMRLFRTEMIEEMRATRAQMAVLNETLAKISSRVIKCEERMDKLQERLSGMEHSIENGATEGNNKSLEASMTELRLELNDRDQELLLNDVEIACIPEQKVESLPHIVTTLANKLGVQLTDQDVVSATRVGYVSSSSQVGEHRPRPIVVRLSRRIVRDRLLQAARVRRGATTEGLDIPEPSRRFYVNERLTKNNRLLFRRARDLGNQMNWRYVWTRDGRIYVRQFQNKDAPRFRIRTEDDIARIFGQDVVCPSA
ncbi:uncharacterized protein LOC131845748 [Achroia grisella]|uniref:uncharacterized protein LOC131845748 n=1 Tax=Achroia grisella TaxID=688607 RepID=UPI0027D25D00|nr:uncharacterized protein LOC131845748 [Achroia grisella]